MTDIIQDAKRLLEGATPAPWEWVGYSIETVGGMVLDFQCVTEFGLSGASRAVEVTPEDEQLIAAAPEIAQALAEETWEYGVQSREYSESAKMWSGWGHFAIPFEKQRTRESCEQFIKGRLDPRFEYRLVRRRVSPKEVIE